jgi:hypothetical protein
VFVILPYPALTYKIHAMADGSISSLSPKSAATEAAAWARWMMPSITDLIFITLLACFCFTSLSSKLLNDAGIGWHIRTGQLIVATHHLPQTDPYSSITAGKPWIAWEWLYDVIVGALDSSLALNGAVWFTAVVIATVFAWTFRCMVARGTGLFPAVVLTLLATGASMIHILARPHVLTWLFVVLWFSILDSSERNCFAATIRSKKRWLWFLPLSMILWVNVHGGFLLGLIVCVIFWLSALWTWLTARGVAFQDSLRRIAVRNRLRDLSLVAVLSLAATFANPYGWHLHRHIFSYLTNSFLMNHIEEFQSPNFHQLAPKFFLAIVILTFVAVALHHRKMRVSETLLAAFAIDAGLYASRNLPIASILLVLVIGPILPKMPGITHFSHRMRAVDSRLRGHLWCIAVLLFVFVLDLNGGRLSGKLLADAQFNPIRMPIGALNYLEKTGISEPVLTPDYWGGYVIYRLYPRTKVVIDDRHDLYGAKRLASYLRMLRLQPGWDVFLRDSQSSCLVMPTDAPITAMLNQTLGWKAVYSDSVSTIFRKADPTR